VSRRCRSIITTLHARHPAWVELSCDGRSPDLRVWAIVRTFPGVLGCPVVSFGWLAAYSCGGSHGIGASFDPQHRVPFQSRPAEAVWEPSPILVRRAGAACQSSCHRTASESGSGEVSRVRPIAYSHRNEGPIVARKAQGRAATLVLPKGPKLPNRLQACGSPAISSSALNPPSDQPTTTGRVIPRADRISSARSPLSETPCPGTSNAITLLVLWKWANLCSNASLQAELPCRNRMSGPV